MPPPPWLRHWKSAWEKNWLYFVVVEIVRLHRTASNAKTIGDQHTFHCDNYFSFWEIRTYVEGLPVTQCVCETITGAVPCFKVNWLHHQFEKESVHTVHGIVWFRNWANSSRAFRVGFGLKIEKCLALFGLDIWTIFVLVVGAIKA